MAIEKEINLSAVFHVMWERGKRILFFTFIVMMIGALCSLLIHNRYGAEAFLVMNKSKLGERTMEHPTHPMYTFPPLITHNSILSDLMDKYNLYDPPFNLKYPEELGARIGVDVLTQTSVMRIYAELEDAQIAANVANDLATEAVQVSKSFIESEKKSSIEQLSVEVNNISSTVIGYSNMYLDGLQKNLKPLAIAELDTYNTNIATLRQELETLNGSIIELEYQAEEFEKIFSATTEFDMIIPTKRFVFEDNVMLESYREKNPNFNMSNLGGMTFVAESLNTGYLELLKEYKKLMVDLPARKEKRDAMQARLTELEKESKELQKKIFEMDVEEMILKANLDRELEVFSGIDKQESWAPTTVITERQDIYVIREATPSKKKMYPRRSLIVAVVGTMAFLISFLYYLFLDLYGLVSSDETINTIIEPE